MYAAPGNWRAIDHDEGARKGNARRTRSEVARGSRPDDRVRPVDRPVTGRMPADHPSPDKKPKVVVGSSENEQPRLDTAAYVLERQNLPAVALKRASNGRFSPVREMAR